MKNANNDFGSSNGTLDYYRHSLSGLHFTDGVRDLAEACQSYWLIDLILSYQANPKFAEEPFQVWELSRKTGNAFVIICHDGNCNRIDRQIIPFSDFPYDKATLWLSYGVLILPVEY